MTRVWMVRGGKNGEFEEPSFANNRIVLGFSPVGSLAAATSRAAVRESIKTAYPDAPKARISNFLGQLHAFRNVMMPDDLVVLPRKGAPEIAVGKVTGDYCSPGPVGGHARPVHWLKTDAPRSGLDEDVLTTLSSIKTLAEIKASNIVERLLNYVETGKDPGSDAEPLSGESFGEAESVDTEKTIDLGQLAKDQISKFVEMHYHGHSFTHLVAAVLKADGFKVYMSPPGPDDGIDIVAGKGSLGFDSPKIVVQCKSGNQKTDIPTFNALVGAVNNTSADYGLIVSWAGFT